MSETNDKSVVITRAGIGAGAAKRLTHRRMPRADGQVPKVDLIRDSPLAFA